MEAGVAGVAPMFQGIQIMAHSGDAAELSLVRPVVTANTPRLGPFAVIAGVEPDLRMIGEMATGDSVMQRPLYLGRLFSGVGPARNTLGGPVLGAPQAVMLLENLLAWGARSVLFFGWCGAIDDGLAIGDVLHVSGAICDEGTSVHYGATAGQFVPVSAIAALPHRIGTGLAQGGAPVHSGSVWSTDAIFRETPTKVAAFRSRGAVAVDMETSALLSAAAFLGADICCVLVVSDALRAHGWEKGFKDPVFRRHRQLLCRLIADHLITAENGS